MPDMLYLIDFFRIFGKKHNSVEIADMKGKS